MDEKKRPEISDRSFILVSALFAAAGFLIGYGESGELQKACLYAGYGVVTPFVLLVAAAVFSY